MTGNRSAGSHSRRFMTVLAAAFIIAMMLAVPIMVSYDSDAAINEGEAGYSIDMVNPTDEEIDKYGVMTKASDIVTEARFVIGIFNKFAFESPVVTADSYSSKYAHGMKLYSDAVKDINSEIVDAQGVTITYTADSNGSLLYDEYTYDEDYQAAMKAIKQYLGDEVAVGDVLKITGKVKTEYSAENVGHLAVVKDGVKVAKSGDNTQYFVTDIDVTIAFTHGGETKTITATSNFRFMMERPVEYDYHGVAYSDLTSTSKCTIKYGPDTYSFMKGDVTYKVNGDDHSAEYTLTPLAPYETTATLLTDDMLNATLADLKAEAAAIPAGTANVTIGREYSDAESAFDEVVVDVAVDDLAKLLLIIGAVVIGIIVLLVVVIIVIVVVMRKKKRAA